MKVYELIPYETWCLWMVKANLRRTYKDYNIRWFKEPSLDDYKDEREYLICSYLWHLRHQPLGKRLESIKANLELSKKNQD